MMTKSLIISCAVILLLFVISSFLSSLCMNTVLELKAMTDALPLDLENIDTAKLREIDALWSRGRFLLSLMVKKDLIVNVDVSVKTLCAYGSADAPGDYHYARFALLVNLAAISEIESISFHSVL